MRLRHEPWGAWARLDSPIETPFGTHPVLLAIDHNGVQALGLIPPAFASNHVSAPLEVHVAITSRCGAGCKGCYLDATPDGDHVAARNIEATLQALAAQGIFTVAFGGGEPTTHPELGSFAKSARALGMTPVVTTSGLNLTEVRVDALRHFAQVNVSYDGIGEDYERVRGFDGGARAEAAIARLTAEGIRVGVNVVLTSATYDSLADTLERVRSLGAKEAQLLRYKPQGRAKDLSYLTQRLTSHQARTLGPQLRELSARFSPLGFGIRIDCALVPFLSADPELATQPEKLAQFGLFGCEAGGSLMAARADGRLAPCSFAEPSETRSINLAKREADPVLKAYRTFVDTGPEPCNTCSLQSICKGGCKIVSTYSLGKIAPDPECPRVEDHQA